MEAWWKWYERENRAMEEQRRDRALEEEQKETEVERAKSEERRRDDVGRHEQYPRQEQSHVEQWLDEQQEHNRQSRLQDRRSLLRQHQPAINRRVQFAELPRKEDSFHSRNDRWTLTKN